MAKNAHDPVLSKDAAFAQMEQDTKQQVPSAEEVWEQQEVSESSLNQTIEKQVHQFEHPEEYESEPIPEHQVLTQNITDLLE